MKVLRTIDDMRAARARAPHPIGFVPTMGALHEGHLSLLRTARPRCDTLVMSIFVNPLQFGPAEDFDRYPRQEQDDLASAESEEVDLVFVPSVQEMYPSDRSTTVHVGPLGEVYEGAARPGHFDGVATVVAKLFGIVRPDVAFFGQKDAQQLAVIKRMVRDLSIPVEVLACDTIRERDGLAMSSRNAYLTPEQRSRAASLWKALQTGAELLRAGKDLSEVEGHMKDVLEEGLDAVDYAAVVDPVSFGAPRLGSPLLLIVAGRLGGTRLIDNLVVEVAG